MHNTSSTASYSTYVRVATSGMQYVQLDFICATALFLYMTLTLSPAGAVGFPRSLGPMGRMLVHWFQPGIDCSLGGVSNVEIFLYTRSKKMAKNCTFFRPLKLMRLRYHCQMVTNVPTTSPWVLGNVGNQPDHPGILTASSVVIGGTYPMPPHTNCMECRP